MLLGTQDKDFFPEDIKEKLQFVKIWDFSALKSTENYWLKM